jgi:hypothetical protein
MTLSSILIVLYGKVLLSAILGSKYKFVARILTMLILSNIGTLTGSVADYKFFY